MKSVDFYMDQTGADFSHLSFSRAAPAETSWLASVERDADEQIVSLGWDGSSEWPLAYRFLGKTLEVASLQGSFFFQILGPLDQRVFLDVRNSSGGGFYEHLQVQASFEWLGGNGGPMSPKDFKVRTLSDGSLEPICWRQTFRGEDGFREWVILYLPSPPDSIKRRKGQAIIESGGRTFTLPKGEVSDLALKGLIQYALPNEQGNFVFGPVPPHPTDGLMAKVVRDLLSEMGIRKDS